MKCWITWANYHYLRLTEAAQLIGLAEPAFVKFLALARDRAACQVFAGGLPTWTEPSWCGVQRRNRAGLPQSPSVSLTSSPSRTW